MRVLHYIQADKHCTDFMEKCKSGQVCCMEGAAEMVFTSTMKEFTKQARAAKPTIVHIHGCWSVTAWRITNLCLKHSIPFVISTHRQMEPWHVADKYWHKKLPMMLLFQKSIIARAKAVLTDTQQERRNIMSVGYGRKSANHTPWNNNTVAIELRDNPDFHRRLAGLYDKIVDSNPFADMTASEITAMNALLRRGLMPDDSARRHEPLSEEQTDTIGRLPQYSWRKIMLHASDEGIDDTVRRGAAGVCQYAAEIGTDGIDRFLYKKTKNKNALKSDVPAIKPLRLEEISDEEKASENETRICTLMLNLLHETRHGSVSRRHFADMYVALKYTDYNEDKTVRMFRRLRIKKFAERIIRILSETLWLEEGFAPMEAVNDKGTARIRAKLLKSYT